MSGDKVYSPDIPIYQKAPFLHVYILLHLPSKNLPRTYVHLIDINIKHARAWREEGIRKNCQDIYFSCSRWFTPMLLAEVW